MDDESKQIADQLVTLKQQLRQGEIFQSLGTKLGQLMDAVPVMPQTPVELPNDDDGIRELLRGLSSQLQQSELTSLRDEDLMQMMHHIGSPDAAVRDRGVYFFLNDALQQGVISAEQMRLMAHYLLGERVLYAHILEAPNDAIYQRSFAILILSVLVYADRSGRAFMDPVLLDLIVDRLALSITLETDTRGFIGNQGWAHVYTHFGNLLDELTEREQLPRADKLFLMQVLIERLKRLSTPLIFGESERLAGYFVNLTNLNPLYEEAFLMAMKNWRRQLAVMAVNETEADWTKVFNRTRLLSAMLLRDDFSPKIKQYLNAVIDFLA